MENLSKICKVCSRRFEYDERYNQLLDTYGSLLLTTSRFESVDAAVRANAVPFVPFEPVEKSVPFDFSIDEFSNDLLCHRCFRELAIDPLRQAWVQRLRHPSVQKLSAETFIEIMESPPTKRFDFIGIFNKKD